MQKMIFVLKVCFSKYRKKTYFSYNKNLKLLCFIERLKLTIIYFIHEVTSDTDTLKRLESDNEIQAWAQLLSGKYDDGGCQIQVCIVTLSSNFVVKW